MDIVFLLLKTMGEYLICITVVYVKMLTSRTPLWPPRNTRPVDQQGVFLFSVLFVPTYCRVPKMYSNEGGNCAEWDDRAEVASKPEFRLLHSLMIMLRSFECA
jgi:hypothetical protein